MPSTFVRRTETPRKPELPLIVQRSLHAEMAHADMEGYLAGVRDAIGALKRKGYVEAALMLEALRDGVLVKLGDAG